MNRTRTGYLLLAGLSLAIFVATACSDESAEVGGPGGTATASGSGGSTSSGTAGGGGGTAGSGNFIPPPPTEKAYCLNQLYECGDLEDNDGDGLIDYQDPDCLGPCDNTEDSYYPDLPGESGQDCDLDCFWDTGLGHEELCYWDHHCDPYADTTNPAVNPQDLCAWDTAANGPVDEQTFPPSPYNCDDMFTSQPQECIDDCMPLAPNGCDCFGCCELPAGSGSYVWLGSYDESKAGTCTLADVLDATMCKPCTPVPGCNNPCEHCELCLGKTELPADCGEGGGPPQQCDPELQPCGLAGQDPCPSNHYCITGCCQPIPS
jgi:hypothetical protein